MQEKKYQYTFTVFTPTYNRADLLSRVYESLARQTYKDFEWLLVDDGSTDNTKKVVELLANNAEFPVRYIWKPNGGVHTADNVGIRNARGKFFSILDSDDWYVDDALENMLRFWNSINEKDKAKFCGVCGLCAYENGQIIGNKFPKDIWDSDDFECKNVFQINGDKIGFKLTDIMMKFPFPENYGRFISESIVWNRIGLQYSNRFVNTVFATKQYQKEGLTDRARLNSILNPQAKILILYELVNSGRRLPWKVYLKSIINLIRFSIHAKLSVKEIYDSLPNKLLILPFFPVAVLFVLRDKYYLYTNEFNKKNDN